MSIKAILLDLDGTLVNTNEIILQCFEHTLKEKTGSCPPREELIKTFGKPLVEVFAEMDAAKADELIQEYQRFQQSLDQSKYITLCDHVHEALDTFKAKGYKLAVVTSKRHDGAYQNLAQFNLLPYFSAIITYEDTILHKPTGEPAKKALELLGVSAEESIMVGDSNFDIQCGKDAGTKTAAVAYSAYGEEFLRAFEPDYFIADLLELAQRLPSLN